MLGRAGGHVGWRCSSSRSPTSLWLLLVGLALLAVASGLVFSTTTALISLAVGRAASRGRCSG